MSVQRDEKFPEASVGMELERTKRKCAEKQRPAISWTSEAYIFFKLIQAHRQASIATTGASHLTFIIISHLSNTQRPSNAELMVKKGRVFGGDTRRECKRYRPFLSYPMASK